MSKKHQLYVGTSGWNYFDWQGRFYPNGMKSREYLGFYAQHFRSVEVNYSFYHLPTPRTYQNWAAQAPAGFVFAVKASRSITHIRRLRDCGDLWEEFLVNASELGNHLGPVLLQLPPSLRLDSGILETFLERHPNLPNSRKWKLAFEFRHSSWYDNSVYAVLKSHGAALVVGHSQRYPLAPLVDTADFVYLRFHGPGRLFASAYPDEDLAHWASLIRGCLSRGKTVYAYFNNDYQGFALRNATSLLQMV